MVTLPARQPVVLLALLWSPGSHNPPKTKTTNPREEGLLTAEIISASCPCHHRASWKCLNVASHPAGRAAQAVTAAMQETRVFSRAGKTPGCSSTGGAQAGSARWHHCTPLVLSQESSGHKEWALLQHQADSLLNRREEGVSERSPREVQDMLLKHRGWGRLHHPSWKEGLDLTPSPHHQQM